MLFSRIGRRNSHRGVIWVFAPTGPNDTWPHVLNATTPEDPNSSAAQTLVLNVASLPEGGANYRVLKTVANGNWFNGNAQALAFG